ncbi:(deoxy)nucleoside triphosphate pyrophosphohydrolase [Microbacterium sp.]|uniref:(deoxy)nucleoside triphosphate pyrophosphohydrolase n=1 Tax=Microbacterium sp. TaxID=51671 RepID=UPI003A83E9A6
MHRVPVVGAVIERDGRVLCARRGDGTFAGLWEFPGGKVEAGETPQQALVREIGEELGCRVSVGASLTTSVNAAPHVEIELTTYRCALIDGERRALEHAEVRWVPVARLRDLSWAPADLATVAILDPAR